MKIRYGIWFTYITIIHFFCWYYVICFCSIYPNNSYPWFYGSIISLLLEFLILGIIVSFTLYVFRYLAQNNKQNRCIISFYHHLRKFMDLIT